MKILSVPNKGLIFGINVAIMKKIDLMVYCICVLSFGLLSDHEPCTTLKLLGMKNSSFIFGKLISGVFQNVALKPVY